MKLKTLIPALSLAFAGAAQADTVASQFFYGFQQLSDNSAEYQSFDANGDGLLGVGDILRGIFTIETIEQGGSTNQLGDGIAHNELTGIFEAVVAHYAVNLPSPFTTNHYYTFAPSAAFEAIYGAGAMIATFDDPAQDYTRIGCATVAGCEASATGGTPFMVLGFADPLRNFWVADTKSNDISVIGAVPAPGNGGLFNTGLDILSQGPASAGLIFNDVACLGYATVEAVPGVFAQIPTGVRAVDVCGSGSLLGTGGVNTPYDSFNNVDFTVNVERVPEPATLGLLGLGLLGLGLARRRKA